jgi:hypothetical protein
MNYIPFFSFYQKQNEPVLIEEEELPSTSMESMNSFQPISSYFDLSANTIKKIGSTEKIKNIEPRELVEPIEQKNEFQEVIEVKIHIPEPEHHSYDIDVDIDVGDIIKNAILDLFRN